MNHQTPDQGWQQLQEIIEGFFDHVLRKEKETALLSASRMEARSENSGIPRSYRQTGETQRNERRIVRRRMETDGMSGCSTSP